MKQITADEFKKAVELDPAWASKLTEPVEITGHCELTNNPISHLSPLLHFTGEEEPGNGRGAQFIDCPNLKIAEGNFLYRAFFLRCGIEKINTKEFIIQNPDAAGGAVTFYECPNLKVAEGTYPGSARFIKCGIEKIDTANLIIQKPNNNGEAADFSNSEKLKVAEGNFPGSACFMDSAIEKIGELLTAPNDKGTAANFMWCKELKTATGRFSGWVDFAYSGIKTFDPENFEILQPNLENQYTRIQETPLEKNPEQREKFLNHIFKRVRLEKLEATLQTIPTKEKLMGEQIRSFIQQIKTRERKNAAVEIQID